MSNQGVKPRGLSVTRRPGQQVRIGDDIYITVTKLRGNLIRLVIDAPPAISIERVEADSQDSEGA